MTDFMPFIECNRSLLIAPAGHGKTTAIADSIMLCPDDECQLILTHTHAGIASLKTKFFQKHIPSSKYKLETITGFAQRYVLSLLGSFVLPDENDKHYFKIAVQQCSSLLKSRSIQLILKSSFGGVFVDEYQDCTIDQHDMIMKLAEILPVHILGDPLQGIFSFENSELVDLETDLCDFSRFELLHHPWRWECSNPVLGRYVLSVRNDLENRRVLHLRDYSKYDIQFVHTSSEENEKYRFLRSILNHDHSDSVLIICPSYLDANGRLRGDLMDRIKLKQRIDNSDSFVVIDAIDSKEYYSCAKSIDSCIEKCRRSTSVKRVTKLYDDVFGKLHLNKTELNKWIDRGKNAFKQRKKPNDLISASLLSSYGKFENEVTYENLKELILAIINLPSIKVYHRTFLHTLLQCFEIVKLNDITLYEAMKIVKSRARHYGRKVQGKCIGTTLLIKGLEFDTVILWDAHNFQDAKNFYVAISRACRKLIIMSERSALKFD